MQEGWQVPLVSIDLCGGGRSKEKAKRREKKGNELHTWEHSRKPDTCVKLVRNNILTLVRVIKPHQ
jgi:hypothetical protein